MATQTRCKIFNKSGGFTLKEAVCSVEVMCHVINRLFYNHEALKIHPAQEGGEYSPNVSSVKDSPPTGGRITSSLVEGGRHRNSNSPPARTRPLIGPLFQHGETH